MFTRLQATEIMSVSQSIFQCAALTIYRSWSCGGACHRHYRDLQDAFCVCLLGWSTFSPGVENSSSQIVVKTSQNLPTRPCPWLTCPRSFLVLEFLVGYQRWHPNYQHWQSLQVLPHPVWLANRLAQTHMWPSLPSDKRWILASNVHSKRYYKTIVS